MPTHHPFNRWIAIAVVTLSLFAVVLTRGSDAQAPAPTPAGPDTVELLFVQNSAVYSAPPPAGPAPSTSAAAVSSSQAATVAKLKELKSLLNQGLITQGQYDVQSQKLLNDLVQ